MNFNDDRKTYLRVRSKNIEMVEREDKFISFYKIYIILSIFSVSFIYFPNLVEPFFTPRMFIVIFLQFILSILLIFDLYKRGEGKINLHPVFIIPVLLFTWSIISSVFNDTFFYSLQKLPLQFLFISNMFLFYLLFRKKNELAGYAINCVVIAAVLISLIAIFQKFGFLTETIIGNPDAMPYSTMGNKNNLSIYLFASLPFSLLNFFKSEKKKIILNSIFLAVVFTSIVFTETRSVMLAGGAALVFTIFFAQLFYRRAGFPRKYKTQLLVLSFLLILLVIPFNMSSDHKKSNIIGRSLMTSVEDVSIRQRLVMWENSWRMFLDNPLAGAGINRWRVEFPGYGLEEMGVKCQQGMEHFQSPHNDYFYLLAELGLPGFFLLLLFFTLIYMILFRSFKEAGSDEKRVFFLIMLFTHTGVIIISFFDFPRDRIEFLSLYSILIALSISRAGDIKMPFLNRLYLKTSPVYIPVALSLMGLVFSAITFSILESEYHLANAYKFHENNNPVNVTREISEAEGLVSYMTDNSLPINWYSGVAFFNMGNLAGAETEFRKALEVHPNNILVLNNIAGVFSRMGEREKAINYYNKALTISPRFEDARLNLVITCYNAGMIEEAKVIFNKYKFNLLAEKAEKVKIAINSKSG